MYKKYYNKNVFILIFFFIFMKNSITLIAPSWAWKTTQWKLLAEYFWYNFIDFDDDILEKIDLKTAQNFLDKYNIKNIKVNDLAWKSVSELLEILWEKNFKKLEEFLTLNLELKEKTILATSWSQVYSELAMQTLQKISDIIYLEIPLVEITKRIASMKVDRIVWMNWKDDFETYKKVMEERLKLYEKYSNYKFKIKNKTPFKINKDWKKELNKNWIPILEDYPKEIKNPEKSIKFNFENFKKFLLKKWIIKKWA